jgi:PPOX class probable F420-dependent enzyme
MDSDLALVRRLAAAEHGLAVVSTVRHDGTVQASVVNATVTTHPLDGSPVVGFVARGGTRKLQNLRRRPHLTLVLRHVWDWVAVEGAVTLVGPDDTTLGLDAEQVRRLLRQVFVDAGGRHDDFEEYDRVMAEERRTVVLLSPDRIYSNPPHARHVEP